MTREQLILWNHLNALVDISASVPLFYESVIGGSEFIAYSATKLYFCLEMQAGKTGVAGTAALLTFNDENDLLILNFQHNSLSWNGAADRFSGNYISLTNFYFSRVINSGYSHFKFIGYRLTYS
jgi:hypothetical protein